MLVETYKRVWPSSVCRQIQYLICIGTRQIDRRETTDRSIGPIDHQFIGRLPFIRVLSTRPNFEGMRDPMRRERSGVIRLDDGEISLSELVRKRWCRGQRYWSRIECNLGNQTLVLI